MRLKKSDSSSLETFSFYPDSNKRARKKFLNWFLWFISILTLILFCFNFKKNPRKSIPSRFLVKAEDFKVYEIYDEIISVMQEEYKEATENYCSSHNISNSKYFIPRKSGKLLSVLVVARHGERAPLHPLEDDRVMENNNAVIRWECPPQYFGISLPESGIKKIKKIKVNDHQPLSIPGWDGSCFLGELTSRGYSMMHKLGLELKEIYSNLFKENPNIKIRIRAADVSRTLNSAIAVAGPLYNISGRKDQKIEVFSRPSASDSMHIGKLMLICPVLRKKISLGLRHPVWNYFLAQNEDLFNRTKRIARIEGDLEKLMNKNFKVPAEADPIWCRSCSNIKLPCLNNNECISGDDVKQLWVAKSFQYWFENFFYTIRCDFEAGRLRLSPLFADILNYLNNENGGFNVLVAHDGEISAILGAFEAKTKFAAWPAYRSTIIIERWSDGYVRIFYNGLPLSTQVFPDGICEEHVFNKLLSKFIISEGWNNACKSK